MRPQVRARSLNTTIVRPWQCKEKGVLPIFEQVPIAARRTSLQARPHKHPQRKKEFVLFPTRTRQRGTA